MYTTDRREDADKERISKKVGRQTKLCLGMSKNAAKHYIKIFFLPLMLLQLKYPKTKKALLIWIDEKKCSNMFLGLSSTSIHTKQLHFSHNQFVRK